MKVADNKLNGPTAKIDAGKTGKANSTQGLKKDLKTGGATTPGGIRDNDSKVDVSERAQMMQKAREIASQPSVDEAKVARLQKMIDDGSYKVDADKVADRLLDEHLLIPD